MEERKEIVTRKVKSLLKKTHDQNAEAFDLFMLDVLRSFLTGNLSPEQAKYVVGLLEKEGYIA